MWRKLFLTASVAAPAIILRILGIEEIKTVPYLPISHPSVELLIGTVRREYLAHILFWNDAAFERKLSAFQGYYNRHRVHNSLDGNTPNQLSGDTQLTPAQLARFAWLSHCRGLSHTPVAA